MLVAHSFAAMDGGHFPMLSGPGSWLTDWSVTAGQQRSDDVTRHRPLTAAFLRAVARVR